MTISKSYQLRPALILVASTLTLSGVGEAGLTPESLRASAITSVHSERPGDAGQTARMSGLFIAEAETGTIYYYPSTAHRGAESSGEVELGELEFFHQFDDPIAIAHFEGGLYVWDAATQELTLTDLWSGKQRVLWRGEPFVAPSQIAVSPEGVIAVVDPAAGGMFWFAPGTGVEAGAERISPPTLEEDLSFLDPVGLAFLSWDTIAVLDKRLNSIVTISFSFYRGALRIADRRELPLPELDRSHLGDLRAVAAQEGVLYVADDRDVFIYLESEGRLIPASPSYEAHGDVRQLAVSYHDLFVIDGGHIDRQPRTVPVDLTLEGQPGTNQTALLEFYDYLWRHRLLELRQASVIEPHQTLEDFLLMQRVLIVPTATYLDDYTRAGSPFTKVFNQKSIPRESTSAAVRLNRFGKLLCELNPSFCDVLPDEPFKERLRRPVNQRLELVLPSLDPQSRLRKTEIALGRHSVDWHVDRLVFSPEQRRSVNGALLEKLNKDLDAAIERGVVFLPTETWLVTAAVPAAEYDDRGSELSELPRSYEGVQLYSRQRITKQLASSSQPDESGGEDANCSELKTAHREWLNAIHYPFCRTKKCPSKLVVPELYEAEVRVGIVENPNQMAETHQIFNLDDDHPAWYRAVDFDLEEPSQPASTTANGPQKVLDLSTFVRNQHHGTHVAALIGGRKGECWSGLLPHAKLVLIDPTDPGLMRDEVANAIDSSTMVFNISQELPVNSSDKLKEFIEGRGAGALYIAAAGNFGKNLNEVTSLPYPAALGDEANVVTVTGSDSAQSIIGPYIKDGKEQEGVNFGKKYVDLAAPGRDVISATGDDRYGPATGSSQAAPPVTAAAAYLLDRFEGADQSPGDVKARLIATADWHSELKDKVWGGLLNFEDAVRFPGHNILHTETGEVGELYSLEVRGNPKIQILHKPFYYERRGGGAVSRKMLRFDWILSLRRRPDTSFRVVFRDPETRMLKILLNAELAGTIKCRSYERLNEKTLDFEPADCDTGIEVKQIIEYVRHMPYHIEWPSTP